MKLIFMGTPDFSVQALKSLVQAGHEIVAVYSQPPRPAGRGQKEQKSPVHMEADAMGVEVRTPKSLKNTDEQAAFAALKADAAVVVAYGLILPKAILDACPCFNIHASILPRWRGAAPIQRAIEAGDKTSGVTIMQMDEGLDTGDMLIMDEISIEDMNAGQLHDKLSIIGSRLIVDTLADFKEGRLKPVKQEGEATYAAKISKDEALIDWNKNAAEIERKIRAFNPFPGAYFLYNGEKIKILKASYKSVEHSYKNGEIIDDNLSIAAKGGVVVPEIIQRQGKKAMSTQEMLRGFKIEKGSFVH